MPWWGWIALGVALIGSEVLIATDLVLALAGAAALLLGLAGALGLQIAPALQWASFALLSVAGSFGVRRVLPRYTPEREPSGLPLGEIAIARESIEAGETGTVELRGSSWRARNRGRSALATGERAIVEQVDGLVVHVRSEREALARRRQRRKEESWKP